MSTIRFETKNDPKRLRGETLRSCLLVFLVGSLLACLGFLVSLALFVLLELLVLLGSGVALWTGLHAPQYRILLTEDSLILQTAAHSSEYDLSELTLQDVVFAKQTPTERAADLGAFGIQKWGILIGGVESFASLRAQLRLLLKEKDESQNENDLP